VLGYLQDFLFSPERARTPVRFLSGGERNRVLLARLFAKPANIVVLTCLCNVIQRSPGRPLAITSLSRSPA